MNNVYFGEKGITSTEGNFLANISKEMQNAATERLNGVKFFSTSVAVIGSNEKQQMSVGTTDLSFIDSDLEAIAMSNAFCAWVREAIKEKEEQLKALNYIKVENWAKEQGIEIPDYPSQTYNMPTITEEGVINMWDRDKRMRYLYLEAFASTYGKYIHPDGAYNKARKAAHSYIANPIRTEGNGRDTVLYYREPSTDINCVDAKFLALQEIYRTHEKELNQLKAEVKETVNELIRQAQEKYQEENTLYMERVKEHNSFMDNVRSKFTAWKASESERISKLKIAIPPVLEPIYQVLKKLETPTK